MVPLQPLKQPPFRAITNKVKLVLTFLLQAMAHRVLYELA